MYTFFGQAEAMRSVRKVTTNIGQTPSPHRGPALDLRALILDRMSSTGVWTPNDFLDMGSRAAVDKVLQRLATSNTIRRIDRGRYDVPRVNRLTGNPPPAPHVWDQETGGAGQARNAAAPQRAR